MGYAEQTYNPALLSNNSNQLMTTTMELFHNNNTNKLLAMALLSSSILHNNNTKPQEEVTVTPALPSKANCKSDFAFLLGFFHWSTLNEFLSSQKILSFCDRNIF